MTSSTQARHRLKQFFTVSKWLFTPLALTFLLAAVWQSRLIIRGTLEHSLPVYLILAVLAWMAAHLLSPLFVRIVLNGCGVKVSYHQLLDLHLRYLPARYIPGGIWHTAARVGALHRLGVRSMPLSIFVILENLVALGITLSVGGILVGLSQAGRVWQPIAFLSAAASLIVLFLCPVLVKRLILKTVGNMWYRNYIAAMIMSSIFWSLAAMSFLLFIFALPNSCAISDWLEVVGSYLFSWGIGFIAIFAPQGVGVFEVVAADLMPTNLPFSTFVGLLAGFRLVVILADVLMWTGWVMQRYRKRYFQIKKAERF
jgi:phosphatidylglycerophosphate synthase